MTVDSPRIRSLLRQADRVADAGKRAAAEQLYRQIIDEAPETAQAWYGLAQVIGDTDEKAEALQRAAQLDPAYEETDDPPVEPVEVAQAASEPAVATETKRPPTKTEVQKERPAEPEEVTRAPETKVEERDPHVHQTQPEPPAMSGEITATDGVATLYCANHPTRQTHLRCNRCGKPICSSCANPTPVGYRCPQCIREQEDVYFTATPINYLLAVLVSLPLALLAGWVATLLGFWSIFLAAFAGTIIGRVAFRAAGRRRGRWLPQLVSACVVIGGVLPALPLILAVFFGGFSLQLLFTGIYIVMATGATYYQMR